MQSNDSTSACVSLGQGKTLPSSPQLAGETAPLTSWQQVTFARAHEFAPQVARGTWPSGQLHLSLMHERSRSPLIALQLGRQRSEGFGSLQLRSLDP